MSRHRLSFPSFSATFGSKAEDLVFLCSHSPTHQLGCIVSRAAPLDTKATVDTPEYLKITCDTRTCFTHMYIASKEKSTVSHKENAQLFIILRGLKVNRWTPNARINHRKVNIAIWFDDIGVN